MANPTTLQQVSSDLKFVKRFILDPVNASIPDDEYQDWPHIDNLQPWPYNLTLTQMLHQCGYLMSAIIQHDDAPPVVQAGFGDLMKKIRAELEALDAGSEKIEAIEAFHLFAPMVRSLVRLKKAA